MDLPTFIRRRVGSGSPPEQVGPVSVLATEAPMEPVGDAADSGVDLAPGTFAEGRATVPAAARPYVRNDRRANRGALGRRLPSSSRRSHRHQPGDRTCSDHPRYVQCLCCGSRHRCPLEALGNAFSADERLDASPRGCRNDRTRVGLWRGHWPRRQRHASGRRSRRHRTGAPEQRLLGCPGGPRRPGVDLVAQHQRE